jgi:hypothetical protein
MSTIGNDVFGRETDWRLVAENGLAAFGDECSIAVVARLAAVDPSRTFETACILGGNKTKAD